jgi:LysM repeat protein
VAGLNYVGKDYSPGLNPTSLVNKFDVDFECANNPVSQTSVAGQIATAVAGCASQVSVNNALAAYIQPADITTRERALIASTSIGVPTTSATVYTALPGDTISSIATAFNVTLSVLEAANPQISNFATITPGELINIPTITGIAPLNQGGVIPATFIPSLGTGYCLGPFGPTATFNPTGVGAGPVKIADWAIGIQLMPFQPVVFMSLLAGAVTGGRPVVEVRISAGQKSYSNQTLVARGTGRSSWNDLNAITVLPTPAAPGHSGVAGTGFAANYNIWMTAWLYDVNNQGVSVNSQNIATAGAYLIRYQA